jgi:hypothetical protein
MKLIIFSSILALAAARPQEFSFGDDEVELIPPVANGGEEEAEGTRPLVILIRGARPNLGSGFPFNSFSGFPFLRNQPRYPSIQDAFNLDRFGDSFGDSFPTNFGHGDSFADSYGDSFGETLEVGLRDILDGLGERGEEDEEDRIEGTVQETAASCGLICKMFGVLTNIAKPVIKTVLDGDFDVNNSTYEEKILEDGSRVRINRTVLSDSDGAGGHFFFQSSIIHNLDDAISEAAEKVAEAAVKAAEEVEEAVEEAEAEVADVAEEVAEEVEEVADAVAEAAEPIRTIGIAAAR